MKYISIFFTAMIAIAGLISVAPAAHAAAVNVNLDSEMDVKGYTDPAKAQNLIDIKLYHLRNCYMEALKKKPGLKGKMTYKWNLDSEGAVVDPTLAGTTIKNNEMEECMINALKIWKFPKPDKENPGVTLKLTLSGTTKQ
jgi:hypothetical protein